MINLTKRVNNMAKATAKQFAIEATKLVGNPYCWGGNGETIEDFIRKFANSLKQEESKTDEMIAFIEQTILPTIMPTVLHDIHFQDCSGLVIEILRKLGVVSQTFDENAEGLFKKCSITAKPQTGALAFFYNGTKHNHVGICIDNETVVHAYSTKAGVICEPISDRAGKWVDFGLLKSYIKYD